MSPFRNLRSVGWYFRKVVSVQPIGRILKDQAVKIFECFTFKCVTDRLPQTIGKELPPYAAA
jgi:hypothetical protein